MSPHTFFPFHNLQTHTHKTRRHKNPRIRELDWKIHKYQKDLIALNSKDLRRNHALATPASAPPRAISINPVRGIAYTSLLHTWCNNKLASAEISSCIIEHFVKPQCFGWTWRIALWIQEEGRARELPARLGILESRSQTIGRF